MSVSSCKSRIQITRHFQRCHPIPKSIPKEQLDQAVIAIQRSGTAVSIKQSSSAEEVTLLTLTGKNIAPLDQGQNILEALVEAQTTAFVQHTQPPSPLSIHDTNRMARFGRK